MARRGIPRNTAIKFGQLFREICGEGGVIFGDTSLVDLLKSEVLKSKGLATA